MASGQYATLQDLYNVYGENNIRVYSDLENNDASTAQLNNARVQAAFDYATGVIHLYLSQGQYYLPLTGGTITILNLKEIESVLAGEWLYRSRGIMETDKSGNKYQAMVNDVMARLEKIKAGVYKLDAARRWPTANTPFGVGV